MIVDMTSRDRSSLSPIQLSTGEMLVGCAAILLVVVIGVVVKASGLTWSKDATWTVGGDFVQFYAAGRILNNHDEHRLYDIDLQDQIYREVVPGTTARKLPFVNSPLVAALFRPLAHLPYRWALFVFMLITPLTFAAALALLNARFGPSPRDQQALVFLAGLSFFPFVGYTWLGAQISVIGFGAIAVALHEEDRGRLFASGLALSLCLYKPSLLLLILPMLALSGSFRQLVGFVAGGCLLTLACVLLVGSGPTVAFVNGMRGMFVRSATAEGLFNPYRWIDLNAFFRLLPYGRSIAGYIAFGVTATAAGIALVSAWVACRTARRAERLLVWAATLTWTLVLNIYTPFYDTILVVAAAILAFAAVLARGWEGWNRLGPALLCVYVAPWTAEISARVLRVQIYTLVLGGFGTLLLAEARRVGTRRSG
jgi:hypothetical protein